MKKAQDDIKRQNINVQYMAVNYKYTKDISK